MVASLPRDVVVNALDDWFPNITSEIRMHRAGERIPLPAGEDEPVTDDDGAAPEATMDSADDGEILGDDDGDILGDADGEDAIPSEVDQEAWASLGGWYRRDYTLFFRPLGHADRFIRTWLDIAASTYGTEAEDRGRILFTELTTKDAPGQCAKCHSIDTEITGILNIKWHPVRPKEDRKPFTWFPHAAHFGMLREEGCQTCHHIDEKAAYQKSYEDLDPTTFQSNFQPLDRQICIQCHTADEAGDACMSCHNYHAGPALPPALVTPLPGAKKTESTMQ